MVNRVRFDAAICRLSCLLLAAATFSVPATAQSVLPQEEIPSADQLFENKAKWSTLKCRVDTKRPSFDFSLEYVAAYTVNIRLSEIRVRDKLTAYVRVKPAGSAPVLLGEDFEISPPPPQIKGQLVPKGLLEPKDVKVSLGGSIALGEGSYGVELLLLDQKGRSFYKRWNLDVGARPSGVVPSRLKRLEVAAIPSPSWDSKLDTSRPCVAILLDATAPRPSATQLRPWDVTFLLNTLPAMMTRLAPRSVRVVAFNLDQQAEVFRSEHFDAAGLSELGIALPNLQLATVPYQALERGSRFKFLSNLIQEQVSSPCQPESLVILGPRLGWNEAAPEAIMDAIKPGNSRVFYFEYYGFQEFPDPTGPYESGCVGFRSGSGFGFPIQEIPCDLPYPDAPDALEHFVRGLHGTVFHVHTPTNFGVSVQTMLEQMGLTGKEGESAKARGIQ